MNNWQKVKDAFKSAVELPIEERTRFLRLECGSDDKLLAEVQSLLEALDEPQNLIEENIVHLASKISADGQGFAGRRFGSYEIEREIGRGGMGAVFLAYRTDHEFEQQVALKIVLHTFASKDLERHFRRERQILANLVHPNIARLLDGGVSEMGEPFLAMEYIDGVPLLEYSDGQALDINERLRLFLKICSAVAYAHSNLVIHQDIKPSNILVSADGEPKLLDFGLARIMDESPDAGQTATQFRAFTPAYASPEQIQGKNIATTSDVYSLGVVLYELLTGERPFDFDNKSFEEILHTLEVAEPIKPSRSLLNRSSESPASSGSVRRHQHALSGELDIIVLKALRKEPGSRYRSVEELAQDIERHLNNLPILARPQTFWYRTGKLVRRNKVAVAAGVLVLLSLVTGIAIASWQASVARRERDLAEASAAKATRISSFLQRLMLTASPSWSSPGFGRDQDITLIEVLDEAGERAKTEFADQPDILATIQHNLGLTYLPRGRYDAAEADLRAALDTSLRLNGEDNAETVQDMRDLAAALMLKGTYNESESYYLRALEIYRKRLSAGKTEGNTLLGFAGSLNDVGLLNRLKGEPATAESFLREALQNAENFQGNERAVVAIVLGHLGMARYEQGDIAGAETIVRRSLDEFHGLPGNQRAETGGSLLNLGIILKETGQFAEAETSIRDGLEVYRTKLGDTHPYTAFALAQLSDLQLLRADYPNAEQNARRSLEIMTRTLPANHPTLAYPLTTLGSILTTSGQPPAGESYLRQALEIRNRVMNKTSLRVAETEVALGESLAAQKKFRDAEPFLMHGSQSLERMRFFRKREDTFRHRYLNGNPSPLQHGSVPDIGITKR